MIKPTDGKRGRGRPKVERSIDKNQILNEALQVFAENGFSGTSVKTIADNVAIDDSLIYYHFKTKINLWNEAIFLVANKYNEEAKNVVKLNKDLSTLNLGKTLTRHMVYFVAENPVLYRIIMHEMSKKSERSDWLVEYILKPFSERLENVLNSYRKKGYKMPMPLCNYMSLNIGVIWTFFLMQNLNKKLYNVDVFDKNEMERHADMVIEIIYSSLWESESK